MRIKSYLRKIRFSFSVIGLAAFLLVMIPNIIWLLAPPINDPLQNNKSIIFALDIIMSIFQYVLIACIILLKNIEHNWRDRKNYTAKSAVVFYMAIFCLMIYYVLWICYYSNIISSFIIFGLAFFPSMFFILLSLWQKNYIATVFALLFALFHITLSCINLL